MDRATELTDAYVEIRFSNLDPQRTSICKRTLNPVWNEDFRFEVSDDSDLQNEPIELRLLDYDTISANDSVGVALIDVNPLLVWEAAQTSNSSGGTSSNPNNSSSSANFYASSNVANNNQLGLQAQTVATEEENFSASFDPTANNATGIGAEFGGESGTPILNSSRNNSSAAAANTSSPTQERQIFGWFPVYDTLSGIRGEIQVQIKLQFFGDVNPFKDSSAGVLIFNSLSFPTAVDSQALFRVEKIFGLVESCYTEHDPEYSWADTFRAPRVSNESRQRVLYRISGQLRRLLGLEALELGGNAIIGYKQYFDSETEGAVLTGRCIGTCVRLSLISPAIDLDGINSGATAFDNTYEGLERTLSSSPYVPASLESGTPASPAVSRSIRIPAQASESSARLESFTQSLDRQAEIQLDRQQSNLSYTASDNQQSQLLQYNQTGAHTLPDYETAVNPAFSNIPLSRTASVRPGSIKGKQIISDLQNEDHFHFFKSAEPILLTIHSLPSQYNVSIGGIVSAKSVKLLSSSLSASAGESPGDLRSNWWWELREEIIGHARALNCGFVIGYSETIAIRDDLYVLSSVGTAVNLELRPGSPYSISKSLSAQQQQLSQLQQKNPLAPLEEEKSYSKENLESSADQIVPKQQPPPLTESSRKVSDLTEAMINLNLSKIAEGNTIQTLHAPHLEGCSACHVSYGRKNAPFPMTLTKCQLCGKKSVPEMLFATCDLPSELILVGEPTLVEAHVCRAKKRKEGESNAAIVSDSLPFIEYDLHRQLMYKLRVIGMNALFGCQFQLSVGDGWMIATATGTAVHLAALPPPPPLKISRTLDVVDAEDRLVIDIQRKIMEKSELSRVALEESRKSIMAAYQANFSSKNFSSNLGNSSILPFGVTSDIPADSPPKVFSPNSPSFPDNESSISGDSSDDENYNNRSDPNSPFPSNNLLSGTALPQNDTQLAAVPQPLQQQTTSVIVQVDDDADEDLMVVLLDPLHPSNFRMMNISTIRLSKQQADGSSEERKEPELVGMCKKYSSQMITLVKEASLAQSAHHPNLQLATVFREMYEDLRVACFMFEECVVYGLNINLDMPKDGIVHVRITGLATGWFYAFESVPQLTLGGVDERIDQKPSNYSSSDSIAAEMGKQTVQPVGISSSTTGADPFRRIDCELFNARSSANADDNLIQPLIQRLASTSHPFVDISPLSTIPRMKIVTYLGRLCLHFVKEDLNLHHLYGNHYSDQHHPADSVLDNDLGRFVHAFLIDIHSIARAHAVSVGGNAVVSFRIDQSEFREKVKNQAYGMVTVSGDIVRVEPAESQINKDETVATWDDMIFSIWSLSFRQ